MKLHSAQDAVKQAIEGGWVNTYPRLPQMKIECYIPGCPENKGLSSSSLHLHDVLPVEDIIIQYKTISDTLLDPFFWQALGKARGWEKYDELESKIMRKAGGYPSMKSMKWFYESCRWFETRLSNGDETKFWESLP